jgi:uncharacterized protein YbjQ (UPF0145 family)
LTTDINDLGRDSLCAPCSEATRREIQTAAAKVVVTTTPSIEGYAIVKYIGIESVAVDATALFSEMRQLHIAKEQAMFALKTLAVEKQANAIVGVDLDYTQWALNRVCLILNGTLVSVVPAGITYRSDESPMSVTTSKGTTFSASRGPSWNT